MDSKYIICYLFPTVGESSSAVVMSDPCNSLQFILSVSNSMPSLHEEKILLPILARLRRPFIVLTHLSLLSNSSAERSSSLPSQTGSSISSSMASSTSCAVKRSVWGFPHGLSCPLIKLALSEGVSHYQLSRCA